jgi:hypothetical protein
MRLRKFRCKEHGIPVTQHTVQRRAYTMNRLLLHTAYQCQGSAKSADTRYRTDRVPFNNLYYKGCFLISDRSPHMGTQRHGLALNRIPASLKEMSQQWWNDTDM